MKSCDSAKLYYTETFLTSQYFHETSPPFEYAANGIFVLPKIKEMV